MYTAIDELNTVEFYVRLKLLQSIFILESIAKGNYHPLS